MQPVRPSYARLVPMFVTLSCLGLAAGCATSAPLVVKIPPPTWRPCQLQAPPADMTVRQAEDRLMEAEAALLACDAQGRGIVGSWPR
jgi:hypothetical protein